MSKTVLTAVVALLIVALIPAAYIMGQMNGEVESSKNSSEADSNLGAIPKPAEEVDEVPAGDLEDLKDWKTFKNPEYAYSFKYPSDWEVERTVLQEPTDWVYINPINRADSDKETRISIHTYFDGPGCPETSKKQFSVGGYQVEGIACDNTSLYKIMMKHSRTVGIDTQSKHKVVLAVAASGSIGIQIDTSLGDDKVIQQILDSITGLTP